MKIFKSSFDIHIRCTTSTQSLYTHGGICQLQPPKAATWSLAALCAGHWDILGVNGKRFYGREKPVDDSRGHYIDEMYEYIYIYIQIHIVYIFMFVEESNKQQLYGSLEGCAV